MSMLRLNEGYDDIVSIVIKLRVDLDEEQGMQDVMTDIRGVKNVITAKQLAPLSNPDSEGRRTAYVNVRFEDDDEFNPEDLIVFFRKSNSVIRSVKILSIDGRKYVGQQ